MQLNPGLPKMAVEQQACLQATREQWRPSSLAAAAQVVVLLLVTGDCPSWALQCRTNMSEFESYTAALRNNPGLLPVRNTQIGRATGFFLRPAGPPCCVFPGLLRCGVASPAAAAGCQRCRQGALPCYSRAWRRQFAAGVRATAPGASGGVHMWCRARSATLLLLTGVC